MPDFILRCFCDRGDFVNTFVFMTGVIEKKTWRVRVHSLSALLQCKRHCFFRVMFKLLVISHNVNVARAPYCHSSSCLKRQYWERPCDGVTTSTDCECRTAKIIAKVSAHDKKRGFYVVALEKPVTWQCWVQVRGKTLFMTSPIKMATCNKREKMIPWWSMSCKFF